MLTAIGTYIKEFLIKSHISESELASRLGYKSHTSVSRIIHGSVSEDSVKKFVKALQNEFPMSAEEKVKLFEAADITLIGHAGYSARVEMERFIRHGGSVSDECFSAEDAATGESIDIMDRYSRVRNVKVTLVNSYNAPVFGLLARLLDDGARVEHFITLDSDMAHTVKAFRSVMGVLCKSGYVGYISLPNDSGKNHHPFGLSHSDIMICEFIDTDGVRNEDMLVFCSAKQARLLNRRSADGGYRAFIGIEPSAYTRFKRSFCVDGGIHNYIQYSKDYMNLEENNSIYKLKPDIGIDYIPANILANAVRDANPERDAEFDSVLNTLEKMYSERFKNTFGKRKPAHTVMKRSAMLKFARTGKLSDHFFAMRPFTVEERIIIINNLIEQQRVNPYFHLYFSIDDSTFRDIEIACYDSYGVLVLDANTDYNLAGAHSEAFICYPEFTELFKQYFMSNVISRFVRSERETMAILREILQLCL